MTSPNILHFRLTSCIVGIFFCLASQPAGALGPSESRAFPSAGFENDTKDIALGRGYDLESEDFREFQRGRWVLWLKENPKLATFKDQDGILSDEWALILLEHFRLEILKAGNAEAWLEAKWQFAHLAAEMGLKDICGDALLELPLSHQTFVAEQLLAKSGMMRWYHTGQDKYFFSELQTTIKFGPGLLQAWVERSFPNQPASERDSRWDFTEALVRKSHARLISALNFVDENGHAGETLGNAKKWIQNTFTDSSTRALTLIELACWLSEESDGRLIKTTLDLIKEANPSDQDFNAFQRIKVANLCFKAGVPDDGNAYLNNARSLVSNERLLPESEYRLASNWSDYFAGKKLERIHSQIALHYITRHIHGNPDIQFFNSEGEASAGKSQEGGYAEIPVIEQIERVIALGFLNSREPLDETHLEFLQAAVNEVARQYWQTDDEGKHQIVRRLLAFEKRDATPAAHDYPQFWLFDAILFSKLSCEWSRMNHQSAARLFAGEAAKSYLKAKQSRDYEQVYSFAETIPAQTGMLENERRALGDSPSEDQFAAFNEKVRVHVAALAKLQRLKQDEITALRDVILSLARSEESETAVSLIPDDSKTPDALFGLVSVPAFEALAAAGDMDEMIRISEAQTDPGERLKLWHAAAKFIIDGRKTALHSRL